MPTRKPVRIDRDTDPYWDLVQEVACAIVVLALAALIGILLAWRG